MSSAVFTSESVCEGHPDKVADAISDAILDDYLRRDKFSRVAVETLVKGDTVVLAGEVTSRAKVNLEGVVRDTVNDIGYYDEHALFNAKSLKVLSLLSCQSPDIAQGVDARAAEGKVGSEQGAGDQGMMFGYACRDTEEFMPAPIWYAHRICRKLEENRHLTEIPGWEWLRPDGKAQVSIRYENGKPAEIVSVVVSAQHAPEISHAEIEAKIIHDVVRLCVPNHLLTAATRYFINPTGRFVIGGPEGDTGLTGRKLMVDSYGSAAHNGGGAFSGKDPSKVDRSAAYMCRYAAKNIVAARLADRCEVHVAYAIGFPEPVAFQIETFGSAKVPEEKIVDAARKVFSFKPADIIATLDLLRPIYADTARCGHFGRLGLPWEALDKVAALTAAIG